MKHGNSLLRRMRGNSVRATHFETVNDTMVAPVTTLCSGQVPTGHAVDVIDTEFKNNPYRFLLIALYGAVLSICLQGFIAGIGNNVFHYPILTRLYDLPQFTKDPYIQSLRNYASLFWIIGRYIIPNNALYANLL